MDKEYLFKITNGVYQVTELFPKQDPLKFKIREKALDILTDLLLASPNPGVKSLKDVAHAVNENIETINGLIDLAEIQDWVDPKNFLVLRREYDKLREYVKSSPAEKEPLPSPSPIKKEKLSSRQKKIVDIIKENGEIQTGEILSSFEGMSKRTLRRDLEKLAQDNCVKRIGKTSQIYYRIS